MPFTSPAQPALDAINESMERQCHLAKSYAAALAAGAPRERLE